MMRLKEASQASRSTVLEETGVGENSKSAAGAPGSPSSVSSEVGDLQVSALRSLLGNQP